MIRVKVVSVTVRSEVESSRDSCVDSSLLGNDDDLTDAMDAGEFPVSLVVDDGWVSVKVRRVTLVSVTVRVAGCSSEGAGEERL